MEIIKTHIKIKVRLEVEDLWESEGSDYKLGDKVFLEAFGVPLDSVKDVKLLNKCNTNVGKTLNEYVFDYGWFKYSCKNDYNCQSCTESVCCLIEHKNEL